MLAYGWRAGSYSTRAHWQCIFCHIQQRPLSDPSAIVFAAHLLDVLHGDLPDLADLAAHAVDGVGIAVIGEVIYAILQVGAVLRIQLISCRTVCFCAESAQEVAFDVFKEGEGNPSAQPLCLQAMCQSSFLVGLQCSG